MMRLRMVPLVLAVSLLIPLPSSGAILCTFSSLRLLHPSTYPDLFNQAENVQPREFFGKTFDGIILSTRFGFPGQFLLTLNTGWLRDLFRWKLSERGRHFKMLFYADQVPRWHDGINHWPARGNILPFKILLSHRLGGHTGLSLKVDYDVPGNWSLLHRPFLDEIVRVPGSDIYLGKFYYRIFGKPILFLWFALRESHEAVSE